MHSRLQLPSDAWRNSSRRPPILFAPVTATTDFLARLSACLDDDSFVRLSLTSPTDKAVPVQRVLARLVDAKGQRQLSFTLREERRDTTKNLPVAEAIAFVREQFAGAFRAAMLATTEWDWQLQDADNGGGKLIRHKASTNVAPSRMHDEAKPTFLGASAQPWLQALSLVDENGRPRSKLADKHAQIDRYTEILAHLADDCGWRNSDAHSSPLRIVDVGCGKGHLTFAAWHLAKNVLLREVEAIGVEVRPDLVDKANELARAARCDGLSFVRGDIDSAPLPKVDALIALHACNTATDHAIRRGVELGAQLIVVAPCCHQQVRPQLQAPEPIAQALRHGLFAERMAEWATDALRTLVLEWAGYATKAIEFVSSEHTGKNLMLAAVRGKTLSDAEQTERRARIDAFRAFFSIRQHALDTLLCAPAGRRD